MKPETITRAQAALPATRAELAQRLGLKNPQYVVKHLLDGGYATEWGDKLTESGNLTKILHATEKKP
jgi:hypothetical protein